jgi:thiol-disulfide isomerase/thioredoxin
MKRILSFIFIILPAIAFLQPSTDKDAPYFKNNGYPDIKLLLTDSATIFTKADLPTDKTVVLIFFSPDCEHCQHTAKEMIKKMDSLSNLVMVWNGPSYLPLEQVKEFYKHYHLANYSNIVMGKEMSYFMPLHYRIEITPYAAIYKNGKFFTEFRKGIELEDLIAIANNTYIVPPQTLIETTPAKKVSKKTKKKAKK